MSIKGFQIGNGTVQKYDYNSLDNKLGVDDTLTVTGAAADAKKTGDEIADLKSAVVFDEAQIYSLGNARTPSAISEGWKLLSDSGLCASDSSYKLLKFTVVTGAFVKIETDGMFQFQSSASVPSSGASNRVGETYGAGTYLLEVPSTATYLILSVLKNDSIANVYNATSVISDHTIQITRNKNVVDSVLDVETVYPINKINPDSVVIGRYLYNGTMDTSDSYRTSDFIPVEEGDLIRFYKKTVSEQHGNITERTTGERIALFDENKDYLSVSVQYPVHVTNGYTITTTGVKYIRISYGKTLIPVALTVNKAIDKWVDYVAPYDESERLLTIEKQLKCIPQKIIDCWGDSRTEMSIGTSYSDYLAGLLGDDFIVQNKGKSGQASGAVAARYGSNEVFVTLNGNTIPASGSVTITGVVCSTGSKTGLNMETADSSRGIRCSINGVEGTVVYQRNGTKAFTRDTDGVAVNVFPITKIIPDAYFDDKHIQILWCGKNDFSYSWPEIVSGIESNYAGMIAMIPHNKWIVLGETYSSDYAADSTNRGYVDTINAHLLATYPDNYIDIQTELVENGLTLENITPTAQDEADIAGGFIPSSLMADSTHLNQYGREAIAKIIYTRMQIKGWV